MATDEAEEQRITAMKLLGELSFALGPDLVMRRVAPQVLHMHTLTHTPWTLIRRPSGYTE